jgi:hypothetical protein
MKYFLGLIVLLFSVSIKTYSQDTLKIGPSYNYSSTTNPHIGKVFASRIEYGLEKIVFNENFKIMEYCYYYDKKRHSYRTTYQILFYQ